MNRKPPYSPAALSWNEIWPGLMRSVLAGRPEVAGSRFVVLYRVAAPLVLDTHRHAGDERVTVLAGTVEIGLGESVGEAELQMLGPGSYVVIPGGTPHTLRSAAGTVLQIHGVGPFEMLAAAA